MTDTNDPVPVNLPSLRSSSSFDDQAHLDESQQLPLLPVEIGSTVEPHLREKLHRLLYTVSGQLGTVYRAMVAHPGAGPGDLLQHTDCANSGVVANRRIIVMAIMEGAEPGGASVARQAVSTIARLLRDATDEAVKAHLENVLRTLRNRAGNEQAVREEASQLVADSAVLADALREAAGVYVYTYPHYWRHPFVPDTERRMLKIGRTGNRAWGRVLSQARSTGMPEDPLLLRVYRTDDPTASERKFHMLLDAAEHERSLGTAVGVEWFITTLEFCDTVATVLGLAILEGSTDR